MTDLLPFLKQLLSVSGLTGHEAPARELIAAAWRPLVDEIHVSPVGSLHALRRGVGPAPRPALLLATHMDAVGLMVRSLQDGFLRLAAVGGLDARILPGQLVTVHGREDLPGVIVQPPAHLLPADDPEGAAIASLWVDLGLPADEVARGVRPGDLISFAQSPFELGGGWLAGHSLDNRASVAALTGCLQALHGRRLNWDVWAVATVQEEETMVGAATSAFALQPTLAVAIDVTFGRGPGSPSHKAYAMGGGPTLGWSPVIAPGVHRRFKDLAGRLGIPTQMEIMPRQTGTDADALQVAAAGAPAMVISIPLRNMHTPLEVVAMQDVEAAARLLAEFALELDDAAWVQEVWDD